MTNIGKGKEHLEQEFFKNCNKDLKTLKLQAKSYKNSQF